MVSARHCTTKFHTICSPVWGLKATTLIDPRLCRCTSAHGVRTVMGQCFLYMWNIPPITWAHGDTWEFLQRQIPVAGEHRSCTLLKADSQPQQKADFGQLPAWPRKNLKIIPEKSLLMEALKLPLAGALPLHGCKESLLTGDAATRAVVSSFGETKCSLPGPWQKHCACFGASYPSARVHVLLYFQFGLYVR